MTAQHDAPGPTLRDALRTSVETTAVTLAASWQRAFDEAQASWETPSDPEDTGTRVNEATAEVTEQLVLFYGWMLAYTALRFDRTARAECRTEVIDRTIKLVVSVRDTWVGTLTYLATGSDVACKAGLAAQFGCTIELNSVLARRYFCFDPDHGPGNGLDEGKRSQS